MSFTVSVFVTSIKKAANGVEITASNGGTCGPPFVMFVLEDPSTIRNTHIGSRFSLSITHHM